MTPSHGKLHQKIMRNARRQNEIVLNKPTTACIKIMTVCMKVCFHIIYCYCMFEIKALTVIIPKVKLYLH